ncbi:lipopolysaccharide transport system ATP-binding protein [Marinilabilia salmonicolor]|jgi:lipopolysaccharide transport system ATP-binding protein|uniref:ABC transporter ATP-binding protein n=1 Tax=Marinilabilia salmonicolor TaxID=989 RepID=UPI000D056545|nr:ABC transporter ATP-binding protein [Marinilabilia salmonicolor]PRZ00818.1 lipopolysaccharide transport system ATP-binding protein [Marinilabilia salmonicolor]
MSNTVIKIENLSKIYRLGEIGTGTLSHDLNRWWQMNIRGKDDPYALVGGVNDRTAKATKGEHIAALKDINLEVKQGEVLGIIGKNGAGKSTLLKVLSRVTSPTTGSISVKGRLASLLEVGTGFHPEMTGRENIYMNGTIMGMRKWEIARKLDEIVEFAGVAKYLDTPVKRYSSGMKVRLGFAVAAHLEPEILVVDEVLAVGDAEFQKKAIGKMQDVSTNDGRTVLFVSHNMASVKTLCTSGMVLVNGTEAFTGDIKESVDFYLQQGNIQTSTTKTFPKNNPETSNDSIELRKIEVRPRRGNELNIDSGIQFTIEFENKLPNINLDCTMEIRTHDEIIVFHQGALVSTNRDAKKGIFVVNGFLPPHTLNAGIYYIKIVFGKDQRYPLLVNKDIFAFEVQNTSTGQGANFSKMKGVIRPDLKWEIQPI